MHYTQPEARISEIADSRAATYPIPNTGTLLTVITMDMPPQPQLISPSKQLAFVLGQRLSFSRFPSPPPPPSSGRRHPGVRIWPLRRPPSCAHPVAGPVASSCARPVAGPVASSCARPVAPSAPAPSSAPSPQAAPAPSPQARRPRRPKRARPVAPSSGPVASSSTPSPPAAPSLSPAPAASLPPSPSEQEMTTIFCKLAANEKVKGNRPTKFLNPAGYKNVEVGFLQQTGKLYSRLQFKNKWGSLRTLYRDWLILKNISTGLAWNDETNTVIADDEWWKKAGEENKDFLQFRKCGPDNLEEMSIMYENINVTGESSMMPGCEHEVLDLEDEIEEIEGTQAKKAKKLPVKIDGHVSNIVVGDDATMKTTRDAIADGLMADQV
ncbi:hypothetical protein D1007_13302 [Hordeum vulgare]|nr:hypothetical protein D1007_13302 [Hordeum vulgare]